MDLVVSFLLRLLMVDKLLEHRDKLQEDLTLDQTVQAWEDQTLA